MKARLPMAVRGPALVGSSDGQPPGPSRHRRQGGRGIYTKTARAQARAPPGGGSAWTRWPILWPQPKLRFQPAEPSAYGVSDLVQQIGECGSPGALGYRVRFAGYERGENGQEAEPNPTSEGTAVGLFLALLSVDDIDHVLNGSAEL